ncbi:MAG: tetratricopeptide repeat protein, partial [Acidobacteriota bacterium]
MPEPGENPRIDELKAQWEADPGGRVYLQLAEEYRKAGDIAQAIEVLEKSLTHRPRDPRGRVALARCHLDLGQPAEAAELLEGVTRQDPAHTLANKLLLESYLQLEDGDKAAERLNIYRLLNDRDPELDHLEYRLSRLTGPSEAEGETQTDPGGEDLAELMVSDLRESSEPSSPPSDTAPQPPEPPVMEADSSAQPETPAGSGASEPVEAMFELAPDPGAPMEPAPETPVAPAPETPVALSPEAETLSADEGAARGTSTPDVFDLPTAAPPERSPEDVFDLGAVGAAAADPVSAPAPVTDVFDLAPLPATVDLDALWGSASVPAAAAESVDSAEPVETVEAEAAQPDPPPTWTEAPSDAGVEIQPVESSSQESQVPETTAEDLQAAESVAVEVETPSTPEDSGVAPESPAVELANEGLETSSTETATLGLLYLKQGHHDEAERIFRRILERDPEHGSALDGLRQLEELRGETADPATSIEPTAASEPEPTQAREAEPELEPEPVLESAPEFEPVPESAPEPETALETAPEPEAVLEVAPELEPVPEIAPELEPAPVQELEPEPA